MMIKIKFMRKAWESQMKKAIINRDYEMAKDVAVNLQDASYIFWKKKKPIPFWIKEKLALFNYYFGWIKQEKDCNEEYE